MCASNKIVLTEHLYYWELDRFLAACMPHYISQVANDKGSIKLGTEHPPAESGIKAWELDGTIGILISYIN